jgi:hypothetical protein
VKESSSFLKKRTKKLPSLLPRPPSSPTPTQLSGGEEREKVAMRPSGTANKKSTQKTNRNQYRF